MKELLGRPGSVSGLLLRVSQFSCAGIAIAVMVTTDGFAEFTCFCYLVASMALQVLWSLGLACLDIYALSKKRDLQNKLLVRLFVVGDWLTATLSLAAASSSSGIAILFVRDFHLCTGRWGLPCGSYKLAVSFTFVTWILTSRDVLKQFYRFNMISCLPALRDLVPLYKGPRIRRDGWITEVWLNNHLETTKSLEMTTGEVMVAMALSHGFVD